MKNLFLVPNARKISEYGSKGRTRILNSCGGAKKGCNRMTFLPLCVTNSGTIVAGKGKKKGKMC